MFGSWRAYFSSLILHTKCQDLQILVSAFEGQVKVLFLFFVREVDLASKFASLEMQSGLPVLIIIAIV